MQASIPKTCFITDENKKLKKKQQTTTNYNILSTPINEQRLYLSVVDVLKCVDEKLLKYCYGFIYQNTIVVIVVCSWRFDCLL